MAFSLDWVGLLKTLAPGIVAAAVPGVGPALAPIIAASIASAEKLGGPSADKKQHALELVRDYADAHNTIAGKEVFNPETTVATASAVIDATVSVVNTVQKVKAAGSAQ
jgi:hypothetical protein